MRPARSSPRALFAMSCYAQGVDATSFTGPQINLQTDDAFTNARIKAIDTGKIKEQLAAGRIVVVAGFQGIGPGGETTTLGRGGSNATLVALGAVLKATVCENYTDVDGVYTADPRIVPNARKIDRITYDEMLELSGLGAGVLQTRAVEFAKKYDVPIHVRNAHSDAVGTMVVKETPEMEDILVSGAALKRNLVRVTLANVPDRPGMAAELFREIAAANIIVDDIIQNVFTDKTANISFTVEDGDLQDIRPVVDALIQKLGDDSHTPTVRYQEGLAKVSVVGVGMRSHTGVARRMFDALAEAKVNIENITTSEIKISCIVGHGDGPRSLQAVHDAFELGEERRRRRQLEIKLPASRVGRQPLQVGSVLDRVEGVGGVPLGGVVAGAAEQGVGFVVVGEERVVAAEADEAVVSGVTGEDVIATTARERVVARAAEEADVGAADRRQHVIARATDDDFNVRLDVVTLFGQAVVGQQAQAYDDRLTAGRVADPIHAESAGDVVGTEAGQEVVVAAGAEDDVVAAGAAVFRRAGRSAQERVIATRADDRVVALATVEDDRDVAEADGDDAVVAAKAHGDHGTDVVEVHRHDAGRLAAVG